MHGKGLLIGDRFRFFRIFANLYIDLGRSLENDLTIVLSGRSCPLCANAMQDGRRRLNACEPCELAGWIRGDWGVWLGHGVCGRSSCWRWHEFCDAFGLWLKAWAQHLAFLSAAGFASRRRTERYGTELSRTGLDQIGGEGVEVMMSQGTMPAEASQGTELGTLGLSAAGRQWFVLHTRSRQEKAVGG